MIETTATAPDAPVQVPGRASRIWRVVLLVATAQLAIIALGMILFSVMGLANDGTGSCGGL